MLIWAYLSLTMLRDSVKEGVFNAYRDFCVEEEGTAVVEYALLITALVLLVFSAALTLYTASSDRLLDTANQIGP